MAGDAGELEGGAVGGKVEERAGDAPQPLFLRLLRQRATFGAMDGRAGFRFLAYRALAREIQRLSI